MQDAAAEQTAETVGLGDFSRRHTASILQSLPTPTGTDDVDENANQSEEDGDELNDVVDAEIDALTDAHKANNAAKKSDGKKVATGTSKLTVPHGTWPLLFHFAFKEEAGGSSDRRTCLVKGCGGKLNRSTNVSQHYQYMRTTRKCGDEAHQALFDIASSPNLTEQAKKERVSENKAHCIVS